MENIERFEQGMADILVSLYKNFPVPIDINVREIDPKYKDDFSAEAEVIINVYRYTYHFLKREGFIINNNKEVEGSHIFRGSVLTSKGFAALNKVPASLKENKTFFEQMDDLKNEGVSTVAKSSLGAIVKLLVSNA